MMFTPLRLISRPLLSLLLVLPLVSFTLSAHPHPEDDYLTGLKAYQRQDIISAMDYLKRAADEGHPKAQSLLGAIYDKAEENELALLYYRSAAQQGDPAGQYGLAAMYANGDGLNQNYAKAVEWLNKSADKGFGPAVDALTTAYLQGGLGLSKSRAEAIALLRHALSMGYLAAKIQLESLSSENPVQ